MEIRAFAEQVLLSESLAEKLTPPAARLSDAEPGQAVRVPEPARPPELRFAPRRTAPAMPRLGGLDRPERRAVVHHIMANHELQALEVMAMVLCGFPDAPAEFRRGLVGVMADEQRHTRLHADRARALDCRFGSLPVNSYIWNKARAFTGVLDYLAGMTLVLPSSITRSSSPKPSRRPGMTAGPRSCGRSTATKSNTSASDSSGSVDSSRPTRPIGRPFRVTSTGRSARARRLATRFGERHGKPPG